MCKPEWGFWEKARIKRMSHEPFEPVLGDFADGAFFGRVFAAAEVAAHLTPPDGNGKSYGTRV
jgi:hypothetical protein